LVQPKNKFYVFNWPASNYIPNLSVCTIMTHSHQHTGSKLLLSAILNYIIALVQIAGGLISNSLALISDSVHNMGDASAILGAWIAHRIGHRKPDSQKTFGYKRIEVITAFANGLFLLVISLYLTIEAVIRLFEPHEIKGSFMLTVAIIGFVANLISVLLLHHEHRHNLNVKAAYLHLMSDTLSSVAVMIGALIIKYAGIFWVDPALTIIINGLILYQTFGILKPAFSILMQAIPDGSDLNGLKNELEKTVGVKEIHHIHLWTTDGHQKYFECHVAIDYDIPVSLTGNLSTQLQTVCKKWHISHCTFQFEHNQCNNTLHQ